MDRPARFRGRILVAPLLAGFMIWASVSPGLSSSTTPPRPPTPGAFCLGQLRFFDVLVNLPLGNAVLAVGGGALIVDGMGAVGEDGVVQTDLQSRSLIKSGTGTMSPNQSAGTGRVL